MMQKTGDAIFQASPHAEMTDAEAQRIHARLSRVTPWLRFDNPRLERDFRHFQERHSLIQVRATLLAFIVLVGLFGLTDLVNFPPVIFRHTMLVRFGLIVPFLCWACWCTWRLGSGVRLHRQLVAAALIAGLGGVLLVYLPHRAGLHTPYEGLMLFMFGIGCFMGLRFGYAAGVLTLMTLAYTFAEVAAGMPHEYVQNSVFRIICTAIASTFGAYILERQMRLVYLHRALLTSYARRDGLTGIANKRAFDEHAEKAAQQAAREKKPVSVMIFDVDHFKQYNDTYGHLQGNDCLKRIAAVLRQGARRPLDLAARFGGEEFVLFLFDTDAKEALRLAALLRERVEALALPHTGSPVARCVTLSGGVATLRAGASRPLETLLGEADAALYRAKADGRNCIVHADDGAMPDQVPPT